MKPKCCDKLCSILLACATVLTIFPNNSFPIYAHEKKEIVQPNETEEIEYSTFDTLDKETSTLDIYKKSFNSQNNAGAFNIEGGIKGIDWDLVVESDNNHAIIIKNSGQYSIIGDSTEVDNYQINVSDNVECTITLNNVKIKSLYAGMNIQKNSKVILNLVGNNRLIAGHEYNAGIEFNNGQDGYLKITSESNGTLNAIGGKYGAGIGGGFGSPANNITINGGTITASSSENGAGIGGGYEASGNNINIEGGNVTAIGEWGAGIGGGMRGSSENIEINGGTVTVSSNSGAGIGGGHGKSATNIIINNGMITANSIEGAGIGGGFNLSGNKITINGGTITSTSESGAGIGGGAGDYGTTITINNGKVTATSNSGAGIGGGNGSVGQGITINNGKVTATSTSGAGIGGGNGGVGQFITINNGTVTATSVEGAGVGEGRGGSTNYLQIKGGSVKASSLGIIPTNARENVYLAKLENLTGVNQVTVNDGENLKYFNRVGDHPDNDGTYYLYLAKGNYTINAGEKIYKAEWNDDTSSFKIRQPSPKPKIEVESKTATSIMLKSLDKQETYGIAEYKIGNGEWQKSTQFTGLTEGTEYTFYSRYQGNDSYLASEVGTVNVKTKQDGSKLIDDKKPGNLTGVYEQKLLNITLSDGWTWVDEETDLSVGNQSYPARFSTKKYESEYDFSKVSGYDENKQYVELNLAVNVLKADTTLSITENLSKIYDGKAVMEPTIKKTGNSNDVTFAWYVKDGNNWNKLDEAPMNVGSYKVIASVEEDSNYKKAIASKEFNISKATNEWTQGLSIEGWTFGQIPQKPTASAKYGKIIFTYSADKDGIYTSEVPTNSGTWYVKATVTGNENYTGLDSVKEFVIAKANSTITFNDNFSLDKTYDKEEIMINSDTALVKMGSTGDISFAYEQQVNGNWKYVKGTPKDAGMYRVRAILSEDENYKSATSEALEFTISKADTTLSIIENLSKIYDGKTVKEPTIEKIGNSNDVTFTWYVKVGNNWSKLDDAPTNAGNYKVVVSVAEDSNYYGAIVENVFEIKKAVPHIPVIKTFIIKQGEVLSSIELPVGFVWKDANQKANILGEQTFKAIYSLTDIENYQIVEVKIPVNVVPTQKPVNHIPTIMADDKNIFINDSFDAKKNVVARDKEDGDLTDKIEIINNTVDVSKVGTYFVTYKVTDKDGASTIKTIIVTVKGKEQHPTTSNKPENGDKASDSNSSIETGNNENILIWSAMVFLSVVGMIGTLLIRSREKYK